RIAADTGSTRPSSSGGGCDGVTTTFGVVSGGVICREISGATGALGCSGGTSWLRAYGDAIASVDASPGVVFGGSGMRDSITSVDVSDFAVFAAPGGGVCILMVPRFTCDCSAEMAGGATLPGR